MYKSMNTPIDNNEMDDIKFLRKLQENVAKLDKLEQYEIFKIIKTYNNKLTENKNGIFINLSSLDKSCIHKIHNFIRYSLDNKKRLDNMEVLSQKLFKNSILNNEYKNFDVSQNNNENLPNLKSKNDKNKDKIKDIESYNNKMSEDQVILNLDLHEDNINLEREYSLYQQNIESDDLSLSGIINSYKKEKIDTDDKSDKDDFRTIDKDDTFFNKKIKFTGKLGRLFKKCKENNKNINLNSIVSYNNYSENQSNDNDDEEDEYCNKINELTEDILE